MKFKNSAFILLLLCILASCEDEETQLFTETAVVEAYLIAGQVLDSVKIQQSIAYSNTGGEQIFLDDLEVMVSDDQRTYELTNIGNGVYQNLDLLVEAAQDYTLRFQYQGQEVSATTYVPLPRPATSSASEITMDKIEEGTFPSFGDQPDPIELEWDNPEGDYYFVTVENLEEDPEIINELTLSEDFPAGAFTFTSEPDIMNFYAIDPRREIRQFGLHQIVVLRVNPEYAALYQSEGTTSTTIAQPPTNVVNGLGIFTGASSDTLFLQVKKR